MVQKLAVVQDALIVTKRLNLILIRILKTMLLIELKQAVLD